MCPHKQLHTSVKCKQGRANDEIELRVGSCTCIFLHSVPVPLLANDRCNKAFVKDGTIHHVVQGARNQVSLKAQIRVPLHRAGRERWREWVTKFISYYTLKCDLIMTPVMTSVKLNQVPHSVLLKVNQCPYWYQMKILFVLVTASTLEAAFELYKKSESWGHTSNYWSNVSDFWIGGTIFQRLENPGEAALGSEVIFCVLANYCNFCINHMTHTGTETFFHIKN